MKLHSCPLQLVTIMTQIIMGRSGFSSLSRCIPSSQGVSLCRSSMDVSFGVSSYRTFGDEADPQQPTSAPTIGELTSIVVTMASHNNQAVAPSATKLVLPITSGSSSEPANKKQKKEAQRRVQHVGVQGPFIKSKWSHIPITFSQ
jgi:hypothetical protein